MTMKSFSDCIELSYYIILNSAWMLENWFLLSFAVVLQCTCCFREQWRHNAWLKSLLFCWFFSRWSSNKHLPFLPILQLYCHFVCFVYLPICCLYFLVYPILLHLFWVDGLSETTSLCHEGRGKSGTSYPPQTHCTGYIFVVVFSVPC